jgi:dTMP kinase
MHDGWSILPDRTFLLVLSIDDALARLADKSGREHFEKREVLEAVQNNYLEYARNEPSRLVIIDASLDKEDIAKFVANGIRQVVRSGKEGRKR